MYRILLPLVFCLLSVSSFSQSVKEKLRKAYAKFENDDQLKFGTASLYIIDAKTGEVLLDKNSRVGLAPASTQKLTTSAAAYELLGKSYFFKTQIGHDGKIENGVLKGNLYIIGAGDPTLGSFRWPETLPDKTVENWIAELKNKGILSIEGDVLIQTNKFAYQAIPGGWIWQDIGNYYGAGAYGINWKENQYDLLLDSENKLQGKVKAKGGYYKEETWINEMTTAGKGTGDNAYVYYDHSANGTIPMGSANFKISAADINPENTLVNDLKNALNKSGITVKAPPILSRVALYKAAANKQATQILFTHQSVPMDSVIYWFNRRSINLYGEALIKAIAIEKGKLGDTDEGVNIVRKFWDGLGAIEDRELRMYDGSGLSPQNRVTTHAQVEVLKFAKTRDWFPGFYLSLPLYNDMKMKSGTINGAKGFTGYHTSKEGKEYIFSFLVNNYSGLAGEIVRKMYDVLNVLK